MKKSELRMMIREIVREEVALTVKEVIKEIVGATSEQKPKPKPKSKKKIAEKKHYSQNSVLNDVINETANGDWGTLGGSKYTTERMSELVGGQYGDLMSDTPQQNINPNDPMSQFINTDYREVLKKTEEKQKQKYGK